MLKLSGITKAKTTKVSLMVALQEKVKGSQKSFRYNVCEALTSVPNFMAIHPIAVDMFQVWTSIAIPRATLQVWLTRDRKSAQYAKREKFNSASNWVKPQKVRVESVIEREN